MAANLWTCSSYSDLSVTPSSVALSPLNLQVKLTRKINRFTEDCGIPLQISQNVVERREEEWKSIPRKVFLEKYPYSLCQGGVPDLTFPGGGGGSHT